jgi:outer membrane receptor protein involved in Fe transport
MKFAALILLLQTATGGQGPATPIDTITGVIRDSAGGVVSGAAVIVRDGSGNEQRRTTGPDGRFTITAPSPGEVVLMVRAGGFAPERRTLAAGAPRQNIEVVLPPATLLETITVTPARSEEPLGSVPASVSVLTRDAISASPAAIADDLLRRLPAFSLFRRTSSIAAHPTAQGVSLRGIGPSGVSRTLVLLDGVPFNDPFGGWVYWTRVPLERADRIEVVDGASSSLYGNYAMGGVINIVTMPPARRTLTMRTQYGNLNSPKFDASASDVWRNIGVAGDVSIYRTDGYAPVVAVNPAGVAERGLVDNKASVDARNVSFKLDYAASPRVRTFVRTGYFREERNNGKHSTIDLTPEGNDTTWTSTSGGANIHLPDQSDLEARVSVDVERFHSNFLAVPAATPPRSIGRMTLNQTVPTNAVGGMLQWRRVLGEKHVVSAGTDWRWVDGDSQEDGLDTTLGQQVTLKRVSGGTQRSAGVFLQDVFAVTPALTVTTSARVDSWRSYNAHNLESNFPSGTPTVNDNPSLPERHDRAVSPRLAAIYHANDRMSVWGSVGGGFRAPTLNELYRQFRVGTTLTLANNQLGPERLVGGEVGIRLVPLSRLTWRTTWFGNRIKDPVSNVTISQAGVNVTQQRQNLGRTRVSGVQTDVEYRLGSMWRLGGGYMYNRARVTENLATPELVGKFLPQVPRHRGTVQVSYIEPKYVNVAVEVLAIGAQFDDDLNARTVPGVTTPGLPKYGIVSLNAWRPIGRRFEAFFGVQNLFDRQYFVGTLPTTIGSPRMLSGGVRVRLH